MSKTKQNIPLEVDFSDGSSETVEVKVWIPRSWSNFALKGKDVEVVQHVIIEMASNFGRIKIQMRPDLEEELSPSYIKETSSDGLQVWRWEDGPSQIRYISGGLGCDDLVYPSELARISERFLAVIEFAKMKNFELHHNVKAAEAARKGGK